MIAIPSVSRLRAPLAVVALVASSALASATAQTTTPANTSLAPWSTLSIQSKKLGTERKLFVATPDGYTTSKARYPVLVLLDADDRPQFVAALANIAFLASRNAIPPMIVVGVPNGKDRTHDLTPVATGATAKLFPTAGGAAAFTDFIVDEVLPRIRSSYRTMPTTVLAGHSFGGLLALHAAAAPAGAFAGIVAMSASLWINDSLPAIAYADSIARAPGTPRLFATSGGFEPPIASTVKRFSEHLDSIKPAAALAFGQRFYPENSHGLTPVPSLMDGLRFVFEPISLATAPINSSLGPTSDSATVVNAFNATNDRYVQGARSLGMPEALPETMVNSLAYAVLQQLKQPGAALVMLRYNAQHYPDSPNAFDSMGDALLAVHDSANAKSQFQHSLDVATRTHQTASAETKKKLAALGNVMQAGKQRP
ncbi:MAG TPA: alpha/beta hydrolase-fold protein [Gemmatimonadaceae bacterium]